MDNEVEIQEAVEQEPDESEPDLPTSSSSSSSSSSSPPDMASDMASDSDSDWESLYEAWQAERNKSPACGGPSTQGKAASGSLSARRAPWLLPPSPALRRPLTAGAAGPRKTLLRKHASCGVGGNDDSGVIGEGSGTEAALGGGRSGGVAGGLWRRRAAFVAGSVNVSQRKLEAVSPPGLDILLPRLPAPALSRIVPALPPAARAALRCASREMRALVDGHTAALTLRPDRRVAEGLNRRGIKAFALFPALRHVTVVLAGAAPPLAALAAAAPPAFPVPYHGAAAGTAAGAAGRGAAGRRVAAASASPSASACSPRRWPPGAGSPLPPSPPLPLSAWLVVCGTAPCLTSLSLHVGDVALLEDLALSVTHPHLQRLDVSIGRCGNPHASPPVVQFMVGVLQGLRHLRLGWAGPCGDAAATSSLAHGPRRLFLDGRPRLGSLLLAALGDLPQLDSLELQGFLIDTEGHAMLARHWPALAGRLRRLVLSQLHLMVPTTTPPGQQLGELVGSCARLQELHADLCLPASAGVQPGAGGAAAAALLLSLMYASRDVRAVRMELLPASLTRLALPGVCIEAVEDLAALGQLQQLTRLEVAGLGARAAAFLPTLQELQLSDCGWQQLLDMLPWRPPHSAAAGPAAQSPASPGGAAAAGAAAAEGPGLAAGGVAEAAASSRRRGGDCRSRGEGGASGSASPRGPKGSSCGRLQLLEVVCAERLDDWHAPDRALLSRVARGLLPLVDSGCRVRLKVAHDAQPHIWNESDLDGAPWEPAAIWRHIKAAHNLRRLQAETMALTERLARGRLLQAARRRDKERHFVDR